MSNPIVTANVFVQLAPAPITLQSTGAAISQGATTLSAGTSSLLTQLSDLTPLLAAAVALTSITWSGGTATATASAAHNVPTGDTFVTTIAGATQAGYNGTFTATSTGAETFTYPLPVNPGASPATGSPTYTPYNQGELVAMVTTYFAEGASVGVYVLELGAGTPAAGVTALGTYIAAPTRQFYRYLLPANWGGQSTAYTLANEYSGDLAQVYFHPTLTLSNYSGWLPALKSVIATVQSPTAAATEFDAAALFETLLANNPSSTQLLGPTSFRYMFGCTAFNPTNSQAVTLKANNLNYVDTGAEGGLTNNIVKFGTDMTGLDCSFWYSIDWMVLNSNQALAADIIQGSNRQPPLFLNQSGINELQGVAQGVANNGAKYGVAAQGSSGPPLVTAVPFATYYADNPNQFELGEYNGLALTFTPNTGFKSVTFNLTASGLAPG